MNTTKLQDVLIEKNDDFLFNLTEIENYNSSSSRLRFWFEHCKQNADKLDGDIFEFGVFKGSSIISIALLLKKIGSKKKVYGFDSFGGFPEYHKYDEFASFELNPDIFEQTLIEKHKLMLDIKGTINSDHMPSNISSSGDFNGTSESFVREKIRLLGLDNIELIVGDFADTTKHFFTDYDGKIFSCNIDCDLYLGYKNTLPYVYNSLVKGGYVHLDEYYSLKFPGARIACTQFFKQKGLSPQKNITPNHEFERWFLTK